MPSAAALDTRAPASGEPLTCADRAAFVDFATFGGQFRRNKSATGHSGCPI
jgi:hypothetical protein